MHMAPLRLLLPLAALWLACAAYVPGHAAQTSMSQPLAGITQLPPTAAFSHLTADEGLADEVAPEITQDAQGFMWFGTFNGLDRYDGYRFVHYRHVDADEHSLAGNVVS